MLIKVTASFKDGNIRVWNVDSWAWSEKGVAMILRVNKEGVVTAEICVPLDAVYFVHVEHLSVATDS